MEWEIDRTTKRIVNQIIRMTIILRLVFGENINWLFQVFSRLTYPVTDIIFLICIQNSFETDKNWKNENTHGIVHKRRLGRQKVGLE